MDLADFKHDSEYGRDPDKSDGSGGGDSMSSQVVINSLSELARVFNFNVVEFRSSSSTNYALTYLYVVSGYIIGLPFDCRCLYHLTYSAHHLTILD